MNILIIPLVISSLLAQFPWSPQPEPPKEKPPVEGWEMVSYFAVVPTTYSREGKGIIKAESRGARSALYRRVSEKQESASLLSWRWKISNVVHSAIETRKDRFDTAARVMVVFGKEQPFRLFQGGDPFGFKIEYIWASHVSKGKIFDHPGERDCKVFVLESGDGRAGQWVSEERNLQRDFKAAFGTDPPPLLAIGLQTDTDHSNEMVTAYYSEPILRKR